MQAVLVMFRSDGERRSFSVTRDMTVVGRREDCDLRIPLSEVSRKHARLVRDGDSLRLEDLGSSNGTFLNGQRVQEAVLSPGDSIQIGPVVFVLQVDGHPEDDHLSPVRAEKNDHSAPTKSANMGPLSPTAQTEHEDAGSLEPLPLEEDIGVANLEPLPLGDDSDPLAAHHSESHDHGAHAAEKASEPDEDAGFEMLDEPKPSSHDDEAHVEPIARASEKAEVHSAAIPLDEPPATESDDLDQLDFAADDEAGASAQEHAAPQAVADEHSGAIPLDDEPLIDLADLATEPAEHPAESTAETADSKNDSSVLQPLSAEEDAGLSRSSALPEAGEAEATDFELLPDIASSDEPKPSAAQDSRNLLADLDEPIEHDHAHAKSNNGSAKKSQAKSDLADLDDDFLTLLAEEPKKSTGTEPLDLDLDLDLDLEPPHR